jgi:hypothetical protein
MENCERNSLKIFSFISKNSAYINETCCLSSSVFQKKVLGRALRNRRKEVIEERRILLDLVREGNLCSLACIIRVNITVLWDVTSCNLMCTDVSYEPAAYIFRVLFDHIE